MAIACRPKEVTKNSAVVTSAMDKDTSFGSDIKSLRRLLYFEKNKAGRKKEEEEEEEEEKEDDEEEEGTSTNKNSRTACLLSFLAV